MFFMHGLVSLLNVDFFNVILCNVVSLYHQEKYPRKWAWHVIRIISAWSLEPANVCFVIVCIYWHFSTHLYHWVFVPASKPFLARWLCTFSAWQGAVGGNESLFSWDSQLPVHLDRDGKSSSCHKHCAFLCALHSKHWCGEKEGRQKENYKI